MQPKVFKMSAKIMRKLLPIPDELLACIMDPWLKGTRQIKGGTIRSAARSRWYEHSVISLRLCLACPKPKKRSPSESYSQ